MKHYTLGEIYRLGLLKNNKGEPYKSKGAVSVASRGLKRKKTASAFGPSYMISQAEIDRFNAAWKV